MLSLFRILISKDLRRARKNPLPWIINLLVPLCMVGLIGALFGGRGSDQALGQVRFGFVDEDGSKFAEFLKRASGQNQGQGQSAVKLEPIALDRKTALAQLSDNKLSAVVIIPKGFADAFLSAKPAHIELIKNPAESIKPTLIEEGLGIVTTAFDGVARNFSVELSAMRAFADGNPTTLETITFISEMTVSATDKIKTAKKFQDFPLVTYETETRLDDAKSKGPGHNIFGFLLAGLAAMFLLFLANTGMSDLHREVQLRTLQRYATHHTSVMPLVAAKVGFVVLMLTICAAVLFAGGGLVFRIEWKHPLELATLVISYALFAAGLMSFLVALLPEQRSADAIVSLVNMGLGILGGCAFPPRNFPQFMREQIMPLLPTDWLAEGVRTLEFSEGSLPWSRATIQLVALALVLMGAASVLFRRRFSKGGRA